MPKVSKKLNNIDINTIEADIDNCVIEFFSQYNIDINDSVSCKAVTHNMLSLCMRYIYKNLFKPSHTMINNQKSLVDYNDTELLTVLANKFIDLCLRFNKSLGLLSFGYMLGCDYSTLMNWLNNKESNPVRFNILKSIQEQHKLIHIGLLNETPVGALATANNDSETGLEWSKNQAQQITNNTVYLLPSERVDKLRLQAPED